MARTAKTAKTLEASFAELNDIVSNIENEEISLEESFKLYSEGMKLVKSCNDSIDKIEKKLIVLNEDGENDGL